MAKPTLNYYHVLNVAKVKTDVAYFTTIQAAIASIAAGGYTPSAANPFAIYVHPGTYEEQITMAAFVDVIAIGGREETIINNPSDTNDEATVIGANALIKGFTIRSYGGAASTYRTRCVNAGTAGFEMEDCILTAVNSLGVTDITLNATASCDIRDCVVDSGGVAVTGALFTTGAQTYNVERTTFDGATDAIQVTTAITALNLTDCTVSDHFNMDGGTVTVDKCNMEAVTLGTADCDFNAEFSLFTGAFLTEAAGQTHEIQLRSCNFGGQNITNNATGSGTFDMYGCVNIAMFTNADTGTNLFYDCAITQVVPTAGTITAYGGRIGGCGANTCTSFIWWLDGDNLHVLENMVIQHAITAANAEDTIHLDAVRYTETITLADGVHIEGATSDTDTPTEIYDDSANPVITAGAVESSIRRVKILQDTDDPAAYCLSVTDTAVLVFSHCVFECHGTDAIHMVNGTLTLNVCNILDGDINVSTATCILQLDHCALTGPAGNADLELADAFDHEVTCLHCDFGGNNVNNAATGDTILVFKYCSDINNFTDAGTNVVVGEETVIENTIIGGTALKSGTTPWLVRLARISIIQNSNGTSAITIWGGYVDQCTDSTGDIVWWHDHGNKLQVISGMKIQHAIDAAGVGDTIYIGPGTFTEALTFDEAADEVTLLGEGTDKTIIYQSNGTPVTLAPSAAWAGALCIENLTIQGAAMDDDYLVHVNSASFAASLVLSNVVLVGARGANNAYAVYTSGDEDNTVEMRDCNILMTGVAQVYGVWSATDGANTYAITMRGCSISAITDDLNLTTDCTATSYGCTYATGGITLASDAECILRCYNDTILGTITKGADAVMTCQHEDTIWEVFAGMEIQDALDVAAANDTIKIGPGTFDEALVIDSTLAANVAVTLQGDGRNVTKISQTDGTPLTINNVGGVVVRDLEIETTSTAAGHEGILIHTSLAGDKILTLYNVLVDVNASGDVTDYGIRATFDTLGTFALIMTQCEVDIDSAHAGTPVAHAVCLQAGGTSLFKESYISSVCGGGTAYAIYISAVACTLDVYNSHILDGVDGGVYTLNDALAHILTFVNCDLNGTGIDSNATAGTTLDMKGCSETGKLTNDGTGDWTVRDSDVQDCETTSTGDITIYGGDVGTCTAAAADGPIVWWLNADTLRVISAMSIQDALDAATGGETILLGPGTWIEAIAMDAAADAVTLKGEGREKTIIQQVAADVVTITVDGVVLEDLTIEITGGAGHDCVTTANATVIRHCNIIAVSAGVTECHGIATTGTGGVTMDSCDITSSGHADSDGIYLTGTGATVVMENIINATLADINQQADITGDLQTYNNELAGGGFKIGNNAAYNCYAHGDVFTVVTHDGSGHMFLQNEPNIALVREGMKVADGIALATADTPAAANPWTVLVGPGIYTEQITMDDYVSVIAEAGYEVTKITWEVAAAHDEPTVTMESNCRLEGFTIESDGNGDLYRARCVTSDAKSDWLIKDCLFQHVDSAVAANQCVFVETSGTGMRLEHCRWSMATTDDIKRGLQVDAAGIEVLLQDCETYGEDYDFYLNEGKVETRKCMIRGGGWYITDDADSVGVSWDDDWNDGVAPVTFAGTNGEFADLSGARQYTCAATVLLGEAVYISAGDTVAEATNAVGAPLPAEGIVVYKTTADGLTCWVKKHGMFYWANPPVAWVAGVPMWLGATGAMVDARPTTNAIAQIIGVPKNTKALLVNITLTDAGTHVISTHLILPELGLGAAQGIHGNWPVIIFDSATQTCHFAFKVPDDYLSTSKVYIVGIPTGAGNMDYTVNTSAGDCELDEETATDTYTKDDEVVVEDRLENLDVTDAFDGLGLVKGRMVGVEFVVDALDNPPSQFNVVGLYMEYVKAY